jgi:hypothetical protein
MLDPKKNQIDYGEQLFPPEGYTLTRAIGTTYSLDLEAFMLLPVALYYASRLDGRPEDLRCDVVEAITKASDKITVFFQKEQLKVPRKYHPLIAFCEHRIIPIRMPTAMQSFHPKVWIIRYDRKDEKPIYRLLITSRNLTFDRSWDMAFSTMGMVTDRQQPINKPLLDFIHYLYQSTGKSIEKEFLADLAMVNWEKPEGFKQLDFLPIGIHAPDATYENPVTRTKWNHLLIISPFLDQTTLNTISSNSAIEPYLLSTKEALDGIRVDVLDKFACRQFSDHFQKAEFYQELEDDGLEPQAEDLHAKFFLGEKGNRSAWYIGSANCTDPAQGRNIEFMVRLTTDYSAPYRVKDVLKQMTDAKKMEGITLFVDYDYSKRLDPTEKQNHDLIIRKLKYEISGIPIYGYISPSGKEKSYDLRIEMDATELTLPEGWSFKVRPISESSLNPVEVPAGSPFTSAVFNDLSETSLSPFIEFVLYKEKEEKSRFLLRMDIDLPATRLGHIMTSIIDSQEKFMKYLAFLLTGEENGVLKDAQPTNRIKIPGGYLPGLTDGLPVFEKLLIACSRHPEKLKDVDNLINMLIKEEGEESDKVVKIITPEFEGFWDVFRKYFNKHERRK